MMRTTKFNKIYNIYKFYDNSFTILDDNNYQYKILSINMSCYDIIIIIIVYAIVFLSQIGADGRRSQIYLALSTASEFRDHLSTFSDFYASLGTS